MERMGISLHGEIDRVTLVEWAQLAESKGYESVWVGENWGRDSISLLAQIAISTKRIKIGTGIANIFSRTPALMAQTAASLDELSGGRMMLGLGTASVGLVEGWHGVKFERSVQRMREYIAIVRLALSGERVDYEGEIFKTKGFRLRLPPVQRRLPIYIAATSPLSIQLAGELADGWLPFLAPNRHFDLLTRDLAVGARRASRALAEVDVVACVPAVVSKDGARATAIVREFMAYYLGAGGQKGFFNKLVTRCGFGAETSAIADAIASGDIQAAQAAVSDEMLDALAISGSPAEGRSKLDAFRAAGASQIVLSWPSTVDHAAVVETIEALAPDR